MTVGTNVCKRMEQAAQGLIKYVRQNSGLTRGIGQPPVVFAVSRCYPTRIILYAAAFQGGWKVQFVSSLREALSEAHFHRPKAIFYDHDAGDQEWDEYCSCFSRERVPFVLLAHKEKDHTFLVVLAAGGYQAWGDPLRSEDVVEAINFAEEVAALPSTAVMQA